MMCMMSRFDFDHVCTVPRKGLKSQRAKDTILHWGYLYVITVSRYCTKCVSFTLQAACAPLKKAVAIAIGECSSDL